MKNFRDVFCSATEPEAKLSPEHYIGFAQVNLDKWNATRKTQLPVEGVWVNGSFYGLWPRLFKFSLDTYLHLHKGLSDALADAGIPKRFATKYVPLFEATEAYRASLVADTKKTKK